MSDENQLTEEQLNEILDSGDPEAIEAALAQLSETDDGFEIKDEAAATEVEEQDAAATDIAAEEAGAKADDKGAQDEQAPASEADGGNEAAVIEGKNGKHTIPYSALEDERRRAQEAVRRANELEQQLAEQNAKDERSARQLEVLTKQLEKNGLDPETLPEDFKLTDEIKEQLVDDFGDAGKAMIALYARIEQSNVSAAEQPGTQQSQSNGTAAEDDVMAAIARNETLEGWRTDVNTDRWEMVVGIDHRLRTDPKFANSSLDDRFAEAVKRTQLAFGDAVDAGGNSNKSPSNVDEAVAEAENNAALPSSLSSMGTGGAGSEKSLAEQMTEMSDDEVTAKLAGMSEEQRESVLAELGF